MFQPIHFRIAIATVATAMSLSLFPHAEAQLTEQEFQMGRAREACSDQARTQMLTVNRVISTTPVTDSAGRMIGAEVILNVTRSGQTYSVRCMYDNTARTANIFNISPPGGTPPWVSQCRDVSGTGNCQWLCIHCRTASRYYVKFQRK